MELFWADLSRIGAGPFTSMVAAVRLFYEAPMVFGSGALRHNHGGFLGVLRSLILLANWLLRWPITGTNVAVFFCALIVLLMQRLLEIRYLNPWLAGIDIVYPIGATLALLAVGGLWMGRRLAHRDIALADVGLSTFVFSSLLLVLLIGTNAYAPLKFGNFSDSPAAYLHMGAAVIMPIWFLWSATIALAIVLLGCLFIARLLPFVPRASLPLAHSRSSHTAIRFSAISSRKPPGTVEVNGAPSMPPFWVPCTPMPRCRQRQRASRKSSDFDSWKPMSNSAPAPLVQRILIPREA